MINFIFNKVEREINETHYFNKYFNLDSSSHNATEKNNSTSPAL